MPRCLALLGLRCAVPLCLQQEKLVEEQLGAGHVLKEVLQGEASSGQP
jgi:hypothetical protein